MYIKKLKEITTFILDVDGVMTNGQVLVTDEGNMLRQFNIKDGFAMQLAVKLGYRICIITGGGGDGVIARLKGLGIEDIFYKVHKKLPVFEKYINDNGIDLSQIAYMGDDITDYQIMQKVGLKCCPADAATDILNISEFVSSFNGGSGCVRELIEKVLRSQQKWDLNTIGIW
ncbi:MAG: HAD hydrolase family protein [Bacteroidetes bacterium]|nr:HAD hydrolase family protein [Bacteroidota bacterium]